MNRRITHRIGELRSWILVTLSFAIGMLIADIVDYQWQASQDESVSVAVSEPPEIE